MTDHGYCTVGDVRRVMQENTEKFDGEFGTSGKPIVVDAIKGLTQWVGKYTKRHWYVSGGVSGDAEGIASTSALQRDDEHSLPTRGAYVPGAYGGNSDRVTVNTGTVFDDRSDGPDPKEEIRLSTGDLSEETVPAYTRIEMDRKDVSAVNELSIVSDDGSYTDWVASSDYDGGVGNSFRGDDYWIRVNNGGVTQLYIDVHALDDEITTLNNAVYVDIGFGKGELPGGVRRGVAMLAASELIIDDEFVSMVTDSGQLTNVESKASRWERLGVEKLSHHIEGEAPDMSPGG